MLAAAEDRVEARAKLRTKILNLPVWEEAILFACARLSRATQEDVQAVAYAIRETLGIDPSLSAERCRR